jgi:hypothetical protein
VRLLKDSFGGNNEIRRGVSLMGVIGVNCSWILGLSRRVGVYNSSKGPAGLRSSGIPAEFRVNSRNGAYHSLTEQPNNHFDSPGVYYSDERVHLPRGRIQT